HRRDEKQTADRISYFCFHEEGFFLFFEWICFVVVVSEIGKEPHRSVEKIHELVKTKRGDLRSPVVSHWPDTLSTQSTNIPSFRPKQHIPGLAPCRYLSDSVTTSVRKDSIPRHW